MTSVQTPHGRPIEAPDVDAIEVELGRLARQLERVRLSAGPGAVVLERAAYALLRELDESGPERLTAAAARMGLDASTVSRQVGALEAAGLVVRDPDPTDRRAQLLRLSAAGRSALRETRAARRGAFLEVIGAWEREDRKRFAALLRRFNDEIAGRTAAEAGPVAAAKARRA